VTVPARVRTPVPTSKDVREVLEGLLGREVTVAPGEPVIPRAKTPATVAVYTDRNVSMRATVVVDLPLSAAIGAGLALLPATKVEDAINTFTLPEALAENLQEVLNVMAASFNVGDAPHVTLYQVIQPNATAPVDVSVMLRTLGRRLDLVCEVEGYGKGTISVVCV
jgi:hypothetical protein